MTAASNLRIGASAVRRTLVRASPAVRTSYAVLWFDEILCVARDWAKDWVSGVDAVHQVGRDCAITRLARSSLT